MHVPKRKNLGPASLNTKKRKCEISIDNLWNSPPVLEAFFHKMKNQVESGSMGNYAIDYPQGGRMENQEGYFIKEPMETVDPEYVQMAGVAGLILSPPSP